MVKRVSYLLLSGWVVGALVTSMVLTFERKRNCIEKEGFFQGWLWCSTDPVTREDISADQLAQFIKGLAWPVMLLGPARQQENVTMREWIVDGTRVRLDSVVSVGDTQVGNVISVSFDPKSNCRPLLSSMSITAPVLGAVISKNKANEKLLVAVDGEVPEAFEVQHVVYRNASEYALIPSKELLKKIVNGTKLTIGISNRPKLRDYPLSQFFMASKRAFENCTELK